MRSRTPKRRKQDAVLRVIVARILADEPMCRRCRMNRSTDGHHRAGRGRFLLFAPLIVGLCRPCHDYVDTHRQEAEQSGYIVRLRTEAQQLAVLAMTPNQIAKQFPLL